MIKRMNKPLPKAYEGFFKAQECHYVGGEKITDSDTLKSKKETSKLSVKPSLNLLLIFIMLLFLIRND